MMKKNTNYDEEMHPSSSTSNRKRRVSTIIAAQEQQQQGGEMHQSTILSSSQSQSKRRSLQSYAQQFVIHHKEPDELSTYKPTSSPTATNRPSTQKPTLNFIPLGPIPSPSSNNPSPNKPPSTWWTQPPTTTAPRPTTSSPTPLPTIIQEKPVSSIITGHAFFDSNYNGIFDNPTNGDDYNMSNVNVWLFTCGGHSSFMIDKTSTSNEGIFTFKNLVSGTYGDYTITYWV